MSKNKNEFVVKWYFDLKDKACLEKLGIKYWEGSIVPNEVDYEGSKHNRGRDISGVDEEHVKKIQMAMLRGDSPFPKIVVRASTKRIAGGMHRHCSYAIKINSSTPMDVIFVECDDYNYQLLCIALNCQEGKELKKIDRIAQAASLFELGDGELESQKTVCAALNLERKEVLKYIDYNNFLSEHLDGDVNFLPQSVFGKINDKARSTKVLDQAWASLIKASFYKRKSQLSPSLAKEISDQVLACKESEPEKERIILSHVNDFLLSNKPKPLQSKEKSNIRKFVSLGKELIQVLPDKDLHQNIGFDPIESDRIREDIIAIAYKIVEIMEVSK